MEHARRMILVPEETINRFQHQTTPSIATNNNTSIPSLDGEITKILKSELADYEKWCLYQQALHKFKNPDSKKPLKMFIEEMQSEKTAIPTAPPTEPVKREEIKKEFNLVVPTKLKYKANKILELLNSSNKFGYNDKGEINIKGQLLQNSNISDLLTDSLQSVSKFKPNHVDALLELLGEINLPVHLINNRERQAQLAKELSFNASLTPKTSPNNTSTPKRSKKHQEDFEWASISVQTRSNKKKQGK